MTNQQTFDFHDPSAARQHLNNTISDEQKAAIMAVAAQLDIAKVLSESHSALHPDLIQHLVNALESVEKIADFLSPDAE